MTRILIVCDKSDKLKNFARILKQAPDMELCWASSPDELIAAAKKYGPHLVVLDENVAGETGSELIKRLMTVDARINTALISTESEAVFHQKTEGLGILAALPPTPGEQDAQNLLAKIKELHRP